MTSSTQSNQVALMKTALQECRLHLVEAATADSADDFELVNGDYESKRDRFTGYLDIILKGNQKLKLPPAIKGSPLEERANAVADQFSEFNITAAKLLEQKQLLLNTGKTGTADMNSELRLIISDELPEKIDLVSTAVDDLLVTVNDMMKQASSDVVSYSTQCPVHPHCRNNLRRSFCNRFWHHCLKKHCQKSQKDG